MLIDGDADDTEGARRDAEGSAPWAAPVTLPWKIVMACRLGAAGGSARPEWSRSSTIEEEDEREEVAARDVVVLDAAGSSCCRDAVRNLSSGVKVATAAAAVATRMILVTIAKYEAGNDLPPGKDLDPSRITHHVEAQTDSALIMT